MFKNLLSSLLAALLALAVALAIIGCGATGAQPTTPAPISGERTSAPNQPTAIVSHGGPVKDHMSFVDALRAKGLTVEITDSIEQPFLRAKGTALQITGGNFKQAAEVQSFNYDDTDLQTDGLKAAAQDASQIESDGQPRTMRIEWIAAPHFFRKERVIAIYVGSDPAVLSLLTELLGPPFAGK